MTEQDGTRADRAWNWVLKVSGLGLFGYAFLIDNSVSWPMAFIAVSMAILPIDDVRAMLRNFGRRGKDTS